ncbi:hypothetical protein MVEN_00251600 [Mycena venus]|uniref:DUF6593 domain-containing protein n=1 Tax=Mycena venus TaxID=2733690 RepID=A0A8H6Z1J3_9AGAR|nr:hypothetical protein MVEN_00251600 [Mycena venus]
MLTGFYELRNCTRLADRESPDLTRILRRRAGLRSHPMHLTVSPYNPINATYRDTESGLEQYKVRTEIKIRDSVTTISRRIDSAIPARRDSQLQAEEGPGRTQPDNERFGFLAQIHWRVVGPTIIQFGDRELDSRTFFRNTGFGLFGWEPKFTALNGREYRWRKKINRTTLEVNGAPTRLVAEYKGKSMGIIGEARKPSLEIFPPFEHMADEIIVAFIYVEKTRKS